MFDNIKQKASATKDWIADKFTRYPAESLQVTVAAVVATATLANAAAKLIHEGNERYDNVTWRREVERREKNDRKNRR